MFDFRSSNQPDSARWNSLLFWAFLHYLAYVFMQTLALMAEVRRGPTIPDLILDRIPVDRSMDWINSTLWLPLLIIFILILAIYNPDACINYLRVGSFTSILRGIFISLTSLGPPTAISGSSPMMMLHLNYSDITPALLFHQWMPIDVLWGGSGFSAAYLTQDLFFSGHTSSTFLLLLVVPMRTIFYKVFFIYHIVTVAGLFITHEHYSIDVLGAYFVVYATWSFFQNRGWLKSVSQDAGESEKSSRNLSI